MSRSSRFYDKRDVRDLPGYKGYRSHPYERPRQTKRENAKSDQQVMIVANQAALQDALLLNATYGQQFGPSFYSWKAMESSNTNAFESLSKTLSLVQESLTALYDKKNNNNNNNNTPVSRSAGDCWRCGRTLTEYFDTTNKCWNLNREKPKEEQLFVAANIAFDSTTTRNFVCYTCALPSELNPSDEYDPTSPHFT